MAVRIFSARALAASQATQNRTSKKLTRLPIMEPPIKKNGRKERKGRKKRIGSRRGRVSNPRLRNIVLLVSFVVNALSR
jgi:hypothetical protein